MTKKELLKRADYYKECIQAHQEEYRGAHKRNTERPEGLTREAYELLIGWVENKDMEITEERLKEIHALCEPGIEAGCYRKGHIHPVWAKHTPPLPEDLDHYMKHFIGQMQISRQMFHPIEFAAICHKRVLEVCPFQSGNEAVAMFVLNLVLMGNGYEVINSFKHCEEAYWKCLVKAQHPSQPDIDCFITFLAQCVGDVEEKQCHQLGIE